MLVCTSKDVITLQDIFVSFKHSFAVNMNISFLNLLQALSLNIPNFDFIAQQLNKSDSINDIDVKTHGSKTADDVIVIKLKPNVKISDNINVQTVDQNNTNIIPIDETSELNFLIQKPMNILNLHNKSDVPFCVKYIDGIIYGVTNTVQKKIKNSVNVCQIDMPSDDFVDVQFVGTVHE